MSDGKPLGRFNVRRRGAANRAPSLNATAAASASVPAAAATAQTSLRHSTAADDTATAAAAAVRPAAYRKAPPAPDLSNLRSSSGFSPAHNKRPASHSATFQTNSSNSMSSSSSKNNNNLYPDPNRIMDLPCKPPPSLRHTQTLVPPITTTTTSISAARQPLPYPPDARVVHATAVVVTAGRLASSDNNNNNSVKAPMARTPVVASAARAVTATAAVVPWTASFARAATAVPQTQPLFGRPSNKSHSLEDELPGNKLLPLPGDNDNGRAPQTIRPQPLAATTTTVASPSAKPLFGRATKPSSSLEDDNDSDDDDDIHDAKPASRTMPPATASLSSNPLFGRPSSGSAGNVSASSLIDDDDDNDDAPDDDDDAPDDDGLASTNGPLPAAAAVLPTSSRGGRGVGHGGARQTTTTDLSAAALPFRKTAPTFSAATVVEPLVHPASTPLMVRRMSTESTAARQPSLPAVAATAAASNSIHTTNRNSSSSVARISNSNVATVSKPAEMSEQELMEAAIAASEQEHHQHQEMRRQLEQQDSSSDLLDAEQIEEFKENARTLRSVCGNDNVDESVVAGVLDLCRADQKTIQGAFENAMMTEGGVDLGDLISLNDILLDAVALGQETLESFRKKAPAKTSTSLEIVALVETKDVFSLICLLRAPQNDRRLDAALALMRFARDAEQTGSEEDLRIRDEIRSSGGMHSLLTLFRTGGIYELKVVTSLALAYVLPSFVQSSQNSPASLGLKIMECLRFLSSSRPVTPMGETITSEEAFKASAMGLTIFWINQLEPMLHSDLSRDSISTEHSSSFGSRKIRGHSSGNLFDQSHATLELQELLEMTVSLIIHIAKRSDSEDVTLEEGDSVFTWRYALVEQVCAIEVARPIAVREGILRVLVSWIKSNDREKLRPAVSALRYLTSIKDKYMAGWIHSQMVNEGALQGILALTDDYSISQDVKLAIAQILSSLCVAPHTRAAVAEANCINYLIGFVYEHSDLSSQEVALFAGSALTQLAAGAITRASVFGANDLETLELVPPDKRDTIVDDIVNSGAVGSFISIALEHQGKLRSVAVGALRVLSEDISPSRQTRLQLCEDGAVVALGITLRDDVGTLCKVLKGSDEVTILPEESRNELHAALCALANIFDPVQERSKSTLEQRRHISATKDPVKLLIQGCVEMTETGGLESLLWIASLPFSFSSDTANHRNPKTDLLEEACRSLASVSPLLLSDEMASKGFAIWADDVFVALHRVLKQIVAVKDKNNLVGEAMELHINVLRGLAALAKSEPLKVRIVDKILPYLVEAKSVRDRTGISNAASQAFQSLAFAEDEIIQVAGNNSNLLVDWFCLKRSLLLQAMARAEIQRCLLDAWNGPFLAAKGKATPELSRSYSEESRTPSGNVVGLELFDSFADDEDTIERRQSLLRQYCDIYEGRQSRPPPLFPRRQDEFDTDLIESNVSLLSRQMYPLNSSSDETDWILSHGRSLEDESSIVNEAQCLPSHIEKFLTFCFPSRLLRDNVIPMHNLCPDSSFNFRALMMPQRRYFSFRREGQLLSRLCEKEAAAAIDSVDIHWTLAFTNSTFSGEFVESLVQTLYLIPMIKGLSFSKNSEWSSLCDSEKDDEGIEGGALLANLVASLPPWISYLTFDGLMDDRNLKTLVVILETVGKLSSGHDAQDSPILNDTDSGQQRRRSSIEQQQTQGKFTFFGLSGSSGVSTETWMSFIRLLGQVGPSTRGPTSTPLSSLKSLDFSGNGLGDDICASILELVHDADSGCCIEELDLSGNRLLSATNSTKVLRGYVEYYRYGQTAGMKAFHRGWKSPVHTLNLASNGLNLSNAWLEIISLLKHNALELKVLDMSNNGLTLKPDDFEYCDLLSSTLLKNTVLCQLNLSNNRLSSAAVERVIGDLASAESGCALAFLRFENNSPSLTEQQSSALWRFTERSKKVSIQRFLNAFNVETDMALPSIVDHATGGLSSPLAPEGNNMITVLFSAPLVYHDPNQNILPFAKLDFDMEREVMWQCLKEASRDIELSFDNATHDRLLATIAKRCSCLHYSGHGHKKYLPFEDGTGGPNWFRVQDIKNLIEGKGGAPFRFVFVSACHSGLAGETFASAGVPHVVCCQQESELKDAAALAFTRQFYLALAVGHTVKESFDQGCKAVRAAPNMRDAEKEMEKFVLLPRNGNHQVPIFNAKPVVEWPRAVIEKHSSKHRRSSRHRSVTRSKGVKNVYLSGAKGSELSVRNMMQEDPSPSPPQFFMGREIDMYHVLNAVLSKRLVSVIGESGVGRSSLVCALCHYINERASTVLGIEHIYHVKAKQGVRQDRCRALIDQLMRKVVEADKANPVDPDADLDTVFEALCKSLKYEKALVVFDHVELLEDSEDANDFPMLLGNLFRETRNVKVLLTGREPLGIPSIGGQVESPFELGPLNFGNTVRLFSNLCTLLHTPIDRRMFFEALVTDGNDSELCYTDHRLDSTTRDLFAMLGDGIPSRIEQAAYDMPTDIFASLMNRSVHQE